MSLKFNMTFFSLILAVASASQVALATSSADILENGAPVLGFDNGCSTTNPTCDWMKKYPDSTELIKMNLPGTHDSATWNYTQATQDSLLQYTGTDIPPADFFQCQEHSIFDMLNGGIRVFDLRYAWNPDLTTVGFYHSQAVLAPNTTLEDVFFGYYSWLAKHPSEAVLISLNHESGTGTPNDEPLQEHIRDLFASDLAKEHWLQVNGSLGTLGEARGKLTLLQRFDYDLLDPATVNPIGIYLDSDHWTDNDPKILLDYNVAKNSIAYIEDYYEMDGLPQGAGAAINIQWKYNATVAHLLNATIYEPNSLYISFASSEHTADVPPETPRIMALGNGTSVPGVNQKLLSWLKQHQGKRLGIVMLDFFDTVPGVVEAILGV